MLSSVPRPKATAGGLFTNAGTVPIREGGRETDREGGR